jgi:hypothetical protein
MCQSLAPRTLRVMTDIPAGVISLVDDLIAAAVAKRRPRR